MSALSVVSGILISFALQPGGVHDEATMPAPTQVQGPHVRLTLSPDGVRFAISGDLADWRLEVVTEQGQPVFDSAVRFERELDWGLIDPQGQPVETGVYAYTLTIHLRDSAMPRVQRGQWLMEHSGRGYRVVPLNTNSPDDVPLTVEESPDRLPVRTEVPPDATATGIRAASASATLSQKTLTPATFAAALAPLSGAGTTGRMTKWIDGPNGVVGDTNVSEANGSVVIGAGAYSGTLQIYGPANDDVYAGMGPDLANGPAFNFGYAGSSFGRGAGFFNVRPDASAVAPNPSLRFMTGNVQRMIISNTGNVAIGTTNVGNRLSVAGPGTAIYGLSGVGAGVLGESSSGLGVYGGSVSGNGVHGNSESGYGVAGFSATVKGVYGQSDSGDGVFGTAPYGFGVHGHSYAGAAVYGTTVNGLAGKFAGTVAVVGSGGEELRLAADASGAIVGAATNHDLQLRAGSNSTKVVIKAAGNVLPGVDALQYFGDPTHRWNTIFATNGMIQTSDARLKHRVTNLQSGLAAITKLRPVSFEWKDNRDSRRHLGLLAQEVEQVLPEVVYRDKDPNAPLGLNYMDLIPVLIKAIQEQQVIAEQKDAQIKSLEARIAAVETALAQLMKSRSR